MRQFSVGALQLREAVALHSASTDGEWSSTRDLVVHIGHPTTSPAMFDA